MTGMAMAHQTWYGAAAGYLGMWMAMMVPMMLPSVVPMLSRYRRSVRGADGIHLHATDRRGRPGLLRGLGCRRRGRPWRWRGADGGRDALGPGALATGRGRRGAIRGGRRAAQLVEGAATRALPPGLRAWLPARAQRRGAWRHGLERGVRCSLSCGSLMLALLAIGMMDLVAMAAVTVAISAERLVPAPARVVRAAGIAIVVVGVLMIARV